MVAISATLGATVAFLIGRYVARDWVASRFEESEKFQAIDKGVAEEGWKIVGLTRLSPVFPFQSAQLHFWHYTRFAEETMCWPPSLECCPRHLMYVYIGSLAGDLADSGIRVTVPGLHRRTRALYAVGLAATIVVTVFVTRIARKALDQKIQ